MSAEEFLKQEGIDLKKTSLICVIDDVMKQPSLVYLMEKYALEKIKSDKNNIFVNIEK
jgi:hypothetical protein